MNRYDQELHDTIENEWLHGRRKKPPPEKPTPFRMPPRCKATVRPYALELRDPESPQDPGCQRVSVPGRTACAQHAQIHDRILARILSLPARD